MKVISRRNAGGGGHAGTSEIMMEKKTKTELVKEIHELRARLHEAEETLHAIRSGEVDAIVVHGRHGERVYSLEGSEHPYRVIVESMNEGAVTLTVDGTILYSNMRFAEMLKMPLKKIISAPFYDFVSKADREFFSELLKKGVMEGVKGRISLVTNEDTLLPVYISLHSLSIDDKSCLSLVITDLTEMLEAETFSNTVLDQAAEAIIVCNSQGLITRVNQAARSLCGRDPYLQPFHVVFPLQYTDEKGGSRARPFSPGTALSRKILKNIEVKMESEQGHALYFILNAGVLTSVQDKNLGCVVTLTDITARKKAEEALEIDQYRFFSLLNELPGYVTLQAPDYSVRYANRHFRKIFGEPDGMPCYQVIYGSTTPCGHCPSFRVFDTKNIITWERTLPDGKVYQVYNYPFLDIDGYPLVLEFGVDITDRKQMEEALRVSENKYRMLFENLPQRIFYKDRNSVYVSCNERYAKDLHIKSDEIRGKTDFDFYPEEFAEKYRVNDKRIMELGQTEEFEDIYVRDGQEMVIHIVKTPIKDEDGNVIGILGIFWDVTEKIMLEREAERSRHLAALGELAAGVGHEINNPMTGIINCAQILLNKSKDGSREKDIASRIVREGDRITKIVHRLLAFARPGDRYEKKSITRIQDIVSDTLILTEAQLRKEGIKILLDIPQNLPEIYIHPQQIQQVFLNIMNNARYALNQKYPGTHEDKIIQISAKEMIIDNHLSVGITFHDHGTGIPPDVKKKILDPFFTTKPRGAGTGLGLSISHSIIKDHNGKLMIDSIQDEFTRITVILPVGGE